jgi:hypothetical protein
MQAPQLIALLAGFLVMLVNGSLYIYGTMTPYIYTFLHSKGTPLPTQAQQWPSATSPSSSPSQ